MMSLQAIMMPVRSLSDLGCLHVRVDTRTCFELLLLRSDD